MADEFIKVEKDGETIEIHPLALEDHKRLGWKVVGEEPAAAAVVMPETEKPKPSVRMRMPKAEKE